MAASQKKIAPTEPRKIRDTIFADVAGIFCFVAILKFGAPVILDAIVQPPENALAAVYESWPTQWGYWLLAPLIAAGLAAIRWKTVTFRWPMLLPLAWLGWQFISATHTVSPALTALTLKHFSACCVLFYLGCFALKGNPWPVWAGLALALCWVLHAGIEQHFGGLEATRRMVYSMQADGHLPIDPAYQRRIASSRIFATFSTPDAMAAAIELLLPMALVFLWQLTPKVRTAIRWLFVGILGGCALACLYWTGSKGGWLVALVMGMLALSRAATSAKWKWILISGLLVLGVTGMGIRFAISANKQKEKVSVATRFSYWRAAIQIAREHPILGTGPGTFSVPYARIKQPEDDFARLCHNDYLEQACDSGIPGAISYSAMIIGIVCMLYRYRIEKSTGLNAIFAVWVGILGLCLHSIVDYHLYVPALAWPMFFLMGFCVTSRINDKV